VVEEPALEAQGSFLSGYFPFAFPPIRQWHYLPIDWGLFMDIRANPHTGGPGMPHV